MNTKTRQHPMSLTRHLLYGMLFMSAAFSALWLRGNALLIYAILAAVIPLTLLAHVPATFFPGFLRQLFQLALAAFALIWAHKQLETEAMDLIMVEVAAILGLALLLGKTSQEHSLLFLISIGFLGYGGLTPGRAGFIYAFIAGLFLSLILLYASKNTQLANDATIVNPTQPIPDRSHGAGLYVIIHTTLTLLLLAGLFHFLQQTHALKTKGLIPVSFMSDQDLEFSQIWQKWFIPPSDIIGGKNQRKTDQNDLPGESPFLQKDPKATKANPQDTSPTMDSREGLGASFHMGDKLVFRAKSPAKLYWVVQMYDDYDGDAWHCSESMLTGHNSLDQYIPPFQVEIPQHISMDNPSSTKLPFAYRCVQALSSSQSDTTTPLFISYSFPNKLTLLRRHMAKLPPTPWNYRVQSFVPDPLIKQKLEHWSPTPRNFGWNYRKLPEQVITERLRTLAKTITHQINDPYEKALAIKNFLRKNCRYNLQAPKVPPNRETVDFFLFDSKEGFCQHFAQAFTVLARLAGLHSRLVTGYAPGNYNLLTNTFEVYEYHAHAWTQIFIEPYGWLTFDGVAPGNLNMRNTPAFLSKLMDPFGDEWKAKPPELSYTPPVVPQPTTAETPLHKDKTTDIIEKVFFKASHDNQTSTPTSLEIGKAATELAKSSLEKKFHVLWDKLRQRVLQLWQSIKSNAMQACDTLKSLSSLELGTLCFCLAALVILKRLLAAFRARLHVLSQLYACRKVWNSQDRHKLTPKQRILICQHVDDKLLKLARFKRLPAQDYIEWGNAISQNNPSLGTKIITIATIAAEVKFSHDDVTEEQANTVFKLSAELCQQLSPYLSQAFVLTPTTEADAPET